MTNIKELINKIGEELTIDSRYAKYTDLVYDPSRGIIPRCLIYEEDGRDIKARGSIVVGLNPGRSGEEERKYYRSKPLTYEAVLEYWHSKISPKPYFKRLRKFVDELGLTGPILWTDLVKCESTERGKLSVQTIRDDINHYLFREIESVPKDWVIIGAGDEAYKILSYRFPSKLVIGIPHPTGSYGYFNRLFKGGNLKLDTKHPLLALLKENNPVAISTKDI